MRIEAIEVAEKTVTATVRVTDPECMRTSCAPDLVPEALELLPGLVRHTCENDLGASFIVEMRDTETAHFLEHVAAELMALSGSPRSLRGHTGWDFARDGRGVFRVALEFDDDLVAIGALRDAARIVEWLIHHEAHKPDPDAMVRDLRELRTRV